MGEERLCGLTMFHVHKDMNVSRENTIRRFDETGDRKIGTLQFDSSEEKPSMKPSMKLWLYLKLQRYFCYENDRAHVIKVIVLVVKITIQLTYDCKPSKPIQLYLLS
jgi:hypothetical protein